MSTIIPSSVWKSNLSLDSQFSFDLQTIAHIVEQFLRSKKSSQTQKAYFRDITDFFEYIKVYNVNDLKAYPIYELSSKVIAFTESYKKTDEYRSDRILNPRTVNRKAYAISSFFEYLVAHYGYPRNPAKVFTPYSSPSKTSTNELSQEEFDAIWNFVTENINKEQNIASQSFWPLEKAQKSLKSRLWVYQVALLFWCLMLSMRRNEVANLRRDDRNRKNNVITVYGKGQKEKFIPLPRHLVELLTSFSELKATYLSQSPYIFSPLNNNRTSDTTKPISGTYIFSLVRKVWKKLQLAWLVDLEKNITPHSFRTTFVKFALEQKYTDIEIMNATGHSTSAMIKYYDSRSPIDANAAKMMDGMFGKKDW